MIKKTDPDHLIYGRAVVHIVAPKTIKNEMQTWCDETFGVRGYWKNPMKTKPWWVRRAWQDDEYEFSFLSEANATLFSLKWK